MFRAASLDPTGKNTIPPLTVPPELAEFVAAIDRLPGQSTFEIVELDGPKGPAVLLKSEISSRSGIAMLFIYGCVEALKQTVKPPHGPSIELWLSTADKQGSKFHVYLLRPGKRKSRKELVAMLSEPLGWESLPSSK